MILAAAGLTTACSKAPPPVDQGAPDAGLVGVEAGASLETASPAERCGQCHPAMQVEWKTSAHARADESPAYVAMRAKNDAPTCDGCHAPLRSRIDPDDLAVHEGVTCEVCHAIKSVTAGSAFATMTLGLKDNVKRGPLCDARDHYFHKMGCSPLHAESLVCAGCHHWSTTPAPDFQLLVFSEYDEWRRGPSGAAGISCQSCHMPGTTAEVAPGSPARPLVPNHGFRGLDGDLEKTALSLAAFRRDEGGAVKITVLIKNGGAGHSVPAGFPGKQVILRVRLLDGKEQEIDRAERVYARVLVNAAGIEVPFYEARAEASDNRFVPEETRREELSFPARSAAVVRAELILRAMSPAVAAAAGAPPPREQLMARVIALPETASRRPPVDPRPAIGPGRP